jgi:hypothetical protein
MRSSSGGGLSAGLARTLALGEASEPGRGEASAGDHVRLAAAARSAASR